MSDRDRISQTVNQVKITFPTPLSEESWRLILQEKPLVEIWVGKDRKKYEAKWDGSQLAEPVEMWFDIPPEIHCSTSKEKEAVVDGL